VNKFMKKLTELDLQNALDECELLQFKSHGDWLAGIIRRLNKVLEKNVESKILIPLVADPTAANYSVKITKTRIKTGNSTEPEVPCKT